MNYPKKNPKKFHCKKCDFSCRNKKDYTRHLLTAKHQMDNLDNGVDNSKNPRPCFPCNCGKVYKYKSGLSKHRKKCPITSVGKNEEILSLITTPCSETPITNEILNKLVEQNNTLMEKVIELSKNRQVINYQNCGNKKMTINVFLNEECKNAMNLTEFVENVKVSLADLDYTKEHGYIKGISNIFAKHLQDLDPKERPIHCSDKKRLQFYVKEADKWEKDLANAKINKTIEDITFKQIKGIKDWENKHPDYLQNDSLLLEWHQMVQHIMGSGIENERDRNQDQIIKSVGNTIDIKDAMVIK